ncbi:hypothetical protein F5Y18DRAFT_373238 [Xylariaceae sp. FL1019]|nr:hypothetical protein F5Y18DRAFT_373238 [Xylariaceae sp. FL1019]
MTLTTWVPTAVINRVPILSHLHRSAHLSYLGMRCKLGGLEMEQSMMMAGEGEMSGFDSRPIPAAFTTAHTSAKPPKKPQRHGREIAERTPSDVAQQEETSKEPVQMASSIPGPEWIYATQGTSLHHIAWSQREINEKYSRKSYIDGVAYMLMALPLDLSETESGMIRDALPPTVSVSVEPRGGQKGVGWRPSQSGRTVLQRCVATLVMILVVLIHALASSLTSIGRLGAVCEKKYNLSQQLLKMATVTGKSGVTLGTKLCDFADGSVGRWMAAMTSSTIEGITAGIQDGIGQGLYLVDPGKTD